MHFFETILGVYAILAGIWLLAVIITLLVIFRRKDLYMPEKILWTVVILFAPVIGLFIYFIWGPARRKIKPGEISKRSA